MTMAYEQNAIPRAALVVNLTPEPSSTIVRSDLPSYDEAITNTAAGKCLI